MFRKQENGCALEQATDERANAQGIERIFPLY